MRQSKVKAMRRALRGKTELLVPIFHAKPVQRWPGGPIIAVRYVPQYVEVGKRGLLQAAKRIYKASGVIPSFKSEKGNAA